MPLSEYLYLTSMKPFFSSKYKYLTMSCSDVIGTETMKASLTKLEVIKVNCKALFPKQIKTIFVEVFVPDA